MFFEFVLDIMAMKKFPPVTISEECNMEGISPALFMLHQSDIFKVLEPEGRKQRQQKRAGKSCLCPTIQRADSNTLI